MVPGATGPPKTRVAVPSANMKLVAGMGQIFFQFDF